MNAKDRARSRAVRPLSKALIALRAPRTGLTLVELVLALGLLALLMVALIQLLDRTLSLWRRGETRRSMVEQAAMITDLMAEDLRGIESGARGDLLCEWVRFDTDKDGVAETKWPRLRLVRPLSAGDVARVAARKMGSKDADDGTLAAPMSGLAEVIWLVAPASTEDVGGRAEGRLWRGERLSADASTKSFLADDFMGPSNQPPGGVTEEVSDGILWLAWLFASQSSVVSEGWNQNAGPESVVSSWDAWARARPNAELHYFNAALPLASTALERPNLPRRIRIEIEIERASDRVRRTFVTEAFEAGDAAFGVDDPGKIPREEGAAILIDAEWMRVTSVDGGSVTVARGLRGTKPAHHDRGAMVHYGSRLVRDVPVVAATQDWKP